MIDTMENRMSGQTIERSAQSVGRHQQMLPKPGKFVLVQCRSFRCLGYYDNSGKWRNAKTVQELPDVRAWCGIEDDTFTPV